MDLQRLNPQQREAVMHGTTPLLVLAGAGTGKTTVITYRIARLLEMGVHPQELLAVTFTNKAAREMRQRSEALAGLPERSLNIGTFHSVCGRLLRQFGHLLGLDRNFVIYDAADQLAMVKRILADHNLDPQLFRPRQVRYRIEEWKNQGLLPDEVTPKDKLSFVMQKVYREYESRCLAANAVDFGGMLVNTYLILERFEQARFELQSRWRYILVDEYQDTNRAQYEILRMLVTPEHSLTVVGDDDQSIYRWRGADIGNILRFENDFPAAHVVRLEENYRSTRNILAAANAVIANNVARKGKNLFTYGEDGPPIQLRFFTGERDEGDAIGEDVQALLKEGVSPGEIAVLYRTNAQSRPIEDALRRRNIAYSVYGGIKFYDRREIKDALGYLRLLNSPRSEMDFLRVVNVPARGIGATTIDRLSEVARQRDLSLFEAARLVASGEVPAIKGRPRARLEEFVALMDNLLAQSQRLNPAQLLELALEESGYLPELRKEGTPEALERRENLTELSEALREYVKLNADATLAGFLEEVSLATDLDDMPTEAGQVSLMTMHSAKGLEFEVVFMPGMEEGVFPHHRSLAERAELEEERRLCYVGITRSKRVLRLSAARVRYGFGESAYLQPSRFLMEIPRELYEGHVLDERDDTVSIESDDDLSFDPDQLESDSTPSSTWQTPTWEEPVAAETGSGFAIGMRVYHRSFGEGDVVGIEGSGRGQRLTVVFPDLGQKTIVARFVERLGP